MIRREKSEIIKTILVIVKKLQGNVPGSFLHDIFIDFKGAFNANV